MRRLYTILSSIAITASLALADEVAQGSYGGGIVEPPGGLLESVGRIWLAFVSWLTPLVG